MSIGSRSSAALLAALLGPTSLAAQEIVANRGQWPPAVRHYVRHGGMQTWLHDGGWTTRLEELLEPPDPGRTGLDRAPDPVRGVVLRTRLQGATAPVATAAARPGTTRYHQYFGADPSRWVRDLVGHGEVRHHGVLPGVDLGFRMAQADLHYDLHLAAQVPVAAIEFVVEGHAGLRLDADGALLVDTDVGVVRHSPPVAWSPAGDGERSPVTCCFELRGPDRFGFAASGRGPGAGLVIDPGLTWSRFLGSSANDFPGFPDSVDVAANGDVLMVGSFGDAASFPQTAGCYQHTGAVRDGFVSRFSPTGALLCSIQIGGDGDDRVQGVAELGSGDLAIVGRTSSTTWPITAGAAQPLFGGGPTPRDGFVACLSGSGATLRWSTYLGGSDDDVVRSVEEASGLIAVGGWTASTDWPVAGMPAQPTPAVASCASNAEGVVAVLDPSGTLLGSTYFGGGCDDWFDFLDVDGAEIVVGGGSLSPDFPVTPNAQQAMHAGGNVDGVIVRLDLLLTSFSYSTYFGGQGNEDARIAVDQGGRIAVGGWTSSTGLPTTPGAPQPGFMGLADAYLAVLDTTLPPGQQIVFLTYLGGANGEEGVNGIAVEPSGFVTVCGTVGSTAFPTTPAALQVAFQGGGWDAWVARVDPWPGAARPLVYSTYLGGTSSFDYAYSCAVTTDGSAAVSVNAGSVNFPTTLPPTHGGGANDAAAVVLDMLPARVFRYGAPSPACHGPLHLSVNSYPVSGNATFEFHANQAPPNSFGMLFLSGVATTPVPVAGVDVWIGVPAPPGIPAISDARGFARFALPIPLFYFWPFGGWQSAWLTPPGWCAPVVASDAIQ